MKPGAYTFASFPMRRISTRNFVRFLRRRRNRQSGLCTSG
nr:MAG TPA: hypothetical protein [Caudoviricetes sp.]